MLFETDRQKPESQPESAECERSSVLFAAIAAVFAAFTVITTMLIVWISYTSVPRHDMWDYWQWLPKFEADWSMLFSQDNEHRIALARLFFLVDQHFFQATGIFLRACTFVSWCLQAALVCSLCAPSTSGSGRQQTLIRVFTYCVVVNCLFSAQQWYNFVNGFQVQFPLMYLLASVAIIALTKCSGAALETSHRNRWFLLALVAAIGSTYSMGGGLLVWPLLLLLGLFLRFKVRHLTAISALGAFMWLTYFCN